MVWALFTTLGGDETMEASVGGDGGAGWKTCRQHLPVFLSSLLPLLPPDKVDGKIFITDTTQGLTGNMATDFKSCI